MSHQHETNPWTATVGTTATALMGANIGRVRVTISPPALGRITIGFGNNPTLDQGITIEAGSTVRTYTYEDIGAHIVDPIMAIADAAGRVVGGIEVFKARA